jgi:NAD(P)-dependent dehydrogenase (short-subunit alcohol dehydrogenase family)
MFSSFCHFLSLKTLKSPLGAEDMFPMKRMGNPQEIANGIEWLCSDESSYTTGHILAIVGGYTAR